MPPPGGWPESSLLLAGGGNANILEHLDYRMFTAAVTSTARVHAFTSTAFTVTPTAFTSTAPVASTTGGSQHLR